MKDDPQPEQAGHFPERETVRRALQGDTSAFEEVVLLYSKRLYAVAHGVLQNPTEAEDVVQETFLKAYSRRWMIRDPEKFPAWLCRIARNRALDLLKKHRPERFPGEDGALEEVPDHGVPHPGESLSLAERSDAIHRLMDVLPENHRIAITLRFMDGMDYSEIGKTMGLSHGALRGLLDRAMKTLRKKIGSATLAEISGG